MDAPAMFTRKQVPEDAGLRNTGADDIAASGGQAQLHREEKEHKPVLKKVKEKVKKIKSTLKGGQSHGKGDEQGRGDRATDDDDMYSGDEEEGDAPLEREAAMEKGGYMDDVEDNRAVASEPDPEVHGAPMYDSVQSERTPPVQDLVAKYDPAKASAAREAHGADNTGARSGNLGGGAAVHDTAPREAHDADAPGSRFGGFDVPQSAPRDDSPKVRLGDLGGPVVEDPAAPRSAQRAAREGEEIGTTPVVRDFENMSLSDDQSHVGAAKTGAPAEEWKDAAADKLSGSTGEPGGGATYTEKLKYAAAVPAEYGRKQAGTVYEKVAGGGGASGTTTAEGDNESTEPVVPVSDHAGAEEFADAPADVDTTAATTTDRSSAAGGQPGYTEKIKSTAAGTALYGKQLASTAYEKVAAVAPSLRPQEKPEEARADDQAAVTPPASDAAAAATTEKRDAMLTDMASTDNTTTTNTNTAAAQSGPGYTDKIKSAAVGTTEYGKQLASTVYEKVAGAGSAVAGKVPGTGAGAQNDTAASSTVTPGAGGPGNGQDKGVGVTGYIAEMLRPSDEDRALSKDISGAVQQRKEGVSGTVGQRVPAPGQVIAKAREAVTSLTGGNRTSETAQPDAATGAEVKENVGAEAPMLRGEEIGERKLNTNMN